MGAEDRIEAALRRQPSDERAYEEPLDLANRATTMRATTHVRPGRAVGGPRQLAALCLVLAVVVGAAMVLGQGTNTRIVRPAAGPSVLQSFGAVQLERGKVDRYGVVRSGGIWVQRGSELLITTDGGESWSDGSIPLPPQNTLAGPTIDVVDAQHAWSVVGNSAVERTSDGGRTWQTSTFGAGCSTFVALSFLDPQNGYLSCGDGAGHTSIFRTHDGGASWLKVNDAARTAAGSVHPYVTATDAETLWAAGGGWESGEEALLGVSRDGGATWTDVQLPGMDPLVKMPTDDVAGTPVLSADDGVVFATLGHVAVSTNAYAFKPRTYRTSDGGHSWHLIDGALYPGGSGTAVSPDVWLAIDPTRGLARTSDAGRSWDDLGWSLPAAWLPSCSVADARENLVVMACQPDNEWPKLMLFSHDGGRTWTIPDFAHGGVQASPSAGTPSVTDEVTIGCWGFPPRFSPSALEGEGRAEQGTSPAAASLRLMLESPAGMTLPKTGWHVAYSSADLIEFVSLSANGDGASALAQKGATSGFPVDGWSVNSFGNCKLEVTRPSGYGPGSWELDPAKPVAPDSTEIAILVAEESCSSGQSPTQDELRAEVRYSVTSVSIVMSVKVSDGPQTCPGIPPVPTVVKLDGPLGDRSLLDGGVWPPLEKATAGSPIVSPSPTAAPGTKYFVQVGDTIESIAARFHYEPDELRLANSGMDLTILTPGQLLMLPTAHGPINCSPDRNDIRAAGFFKGGSMITRFDVYCPILGAGWTVASDNEDQLTGRESADYLEISYSGPSGATLTLRQGRACESTGAACPSPGTEIGAAKFGDKDAKLYATDGGFVIRTVENGTVWELAAKGLTTPQLEEIASSLILVMK